MGGKSGAGPTLLSYLNTIPALADHVIDYVIASHDDSDHYGGLTYILAHGYSATTIYNCCGTNYGSFGQGVAIPVGLSVDLGGGANILCVVAKGHLINGVTFSNSESNNQSIGLLITYGNFHYLTAGDMESAGEGPLGNALRTYPSGSPLLSAEGIDVLHVNHHGSRFSTTASYLNNLKPEAAVINVGANGYGHPHKDAVDRLLARTTYTCDCCDTYQQSTGVTVPAVAGIYQTAEGDTTDCRVSTEGTVAGNIVVTYDGSSCSYYLNGDPFPIDGYVTPDAPHLMVTEAAISDSYLSPENHRWVELYLPPGAPSIDMSTLYWVSRDKKGQLAKNGPLTMIPGDIAITHMATDTVHIDESDNTGKGANGWWDVYTRIGGNYWYSTDDCLMISKENSLTPNASNILDAVVWSNYDGDMPDAAIKAGNNLINNCNWGNPIAGSGLFAKKDQSAAAGSISNGYAQRICTIDTNSKGDWQISPINSEGTPPPPCTPTPTPTPLLYGIPSPASPKVGNPFRFDVVCQPIAQRFDAYGVIVAPGGKIYSFNIADASSLKKGLVALAKDIPGLAKPFLRTLYSNPSIPAGLEGTYTFIVGLVPAGEKPKVENAILGYLWQGDVMVEKFRVTYLGNVQAQRHLSC